MYCSKCGARNDDSAWQCMQCGQPLRAGAGLTQPMPAVPNYLVPAILVTAFCCLPFGIVAIVFAAQVNTKLAVGDLAGAMQSSRQAKLWTILSFASIFVIFIIYVAIVAIMAMVGVSAGQFNR